jgi:hypothetical protein
MSGVGILAGQDLIEPMLDYRVGALRDLKPKPPEARSTHLDKEGRHRFFALGQVIETLADQVSSGICVKLHKCTSGAVPATARSLAFYRDHRVPRPSSPREMPCSPHEELDRHE